MDSRLVIVFIKYYLKYFYFIIIYNILIFFVIKVILGLVRGHVIHIFSNYIHLTYSCRFVRHTHYYYGIWTFELLIWKSEYQRSLRIELWPIPPSACQEHTVFTYGTPLSMLALSSQRGGCNLEFWVDRKKYWLSAHMSRGFCVAAGPAHPCS